MRRLLAQALGLTALWLRARALRFASTQSVDELVDGATDPQLLSSVPIENDSDQAAQAVRLIVLATLGDVSTSAAGVTSDIFHTSCSDTTNALFITALSLADLQRVLQSLWFTPLWSRDSDTRCSQRLFQSPRVELWLVSPATDPSCRDIHQLHSQQQLADRRSHVRRLSVVTESLALLRPTNTIAVHHGEEVPLTGLTLRAPGETLSCVRLSQVRYRLNVSLASSQGAEIRLQPSIRRFIGPLLSHVSPVSFTMEATSQYVGLALRSLVYKAPRRGDADEIRLELEQTGLTDLQKGERLNSTIPVRITRAAASMYVLWHDVPLYLSKIVNADEDSTVSLAGLSLELPFDDLSRDINLTLTIAASHGSVSASSLPSVSVVTVMNDSTAMRAIGPLEVLNMLLSQVLYTPVHNYNGPETIVASVIQVGREKIKAAIVPTSELLHLFLHPVEDPISVSWVNSWSNRTAITVTPATSSDLPPLVIEDMEDTPESAPFFKYQGFLQANVKTPRQTGLTVSHDAVDARRVRHDGKEMQQLTFQGRAAGITKLLRGVHLTMSPLASLRASQTIPVVVSVSHVNPDDGTTSMEVEVYVDVQVGRRIQWLSQVLKQRHLVTHEDSPLEIANVFQWDRLDTLGDDQVDVVVRLSADHGQLYANSSITLSVPSRNHTFECHSLEDLKSVLSRLQYSPDTDFAGNDALSISVGDQHAALGIQIIGINDPPSLLVVTREDLDVVPLRSFVPEFTVSDADNEDVLTVVIKSNHNLSVTDLSFARERGLLIEGLDSIATATLLQVRGTQSAINSVFSRPSVVEVLYVDSSTQNAAVEICVSDAIAEGTCWSRSLDLVPLDLLVQATSGMQEVSFMGALPLASVLSVASMLPPETRVVLRLHATLGSFETSSTSCGQSAETRASQNADWGSPVRLELGGTWTCMQDQLQNTIYRGGSLTNQEKDDEISVELWHANRRYVSRRVSVKLLPPEPRYSIDMAPTISAESVLMTWERGAFSFLATFLRVNVSSAVAEDEDTDQRPLSLNVSCSSSCLLGYDLPGGVYVPYVDYSNADRSPSQTLQFFGTRASLTQLMAALTITNSASNLAQSGDGVIELTLSETDESPFAGAVERKRVAFRFAVTEPAVQWVTRQNEYVTSERFALVDGVRLVGGSDKLRPVHVRVECEGNVQITITVDQAEVCVVDRKCGRAEEGFSIDISGPISVVNSALAQTRVQQRQSSDAGEAILRFLVSVDPADGAKISNGETEVRVHFGSTASKQQTLSAVVYPSDNMTLSLDEDGTVAVGVAFELSNEIHSLDSQLYILIATVNQGELRVPLDDVCCVHVMSKASASTLQLEGTLPALRTALALTAYQPQVEFSGVDSLHVTIAAPRQVEESERVEWSHEIFVQRVNDPPRIDTRLGITTQRTTVDDDNTTALVFFQTQLSIEISDVDVSHLEESHEIIRVQLIATSSFVVPRLEDLSDIVHVLNSVNSVHASGGVQSHQSLTLEASLRTINELLRHVLYTSTSDSVTFPCHGDDPRDNLPSEHLDIVVSDLGHDAGDLEEATSIQRLIICSGGRAEEDAFVSLRLSPDHASLDMRQRTLSISGVALVTSASSSGNLVLGQNEAVRVTGTPAFRVVPEVQRVRLVGPDRLQVLTVALQSPSGVDVTTVTGTFELQTVDPVSNQARKTVMVSQAVAMRANEVAGDEGTGRGRGESMEACLASVLPVANTNVQVVKSIDTTTATWRIYAALEPGDDLLPALQIGATALSVGGVSIVTKSETMGSSLGGSFVLQLGGERTRTISAHATALDVQETLEELASVDVVRVDSRGPFAWDVTFFQPAANVPLLTADWSSLAPVATASDTVWPTQILPGGYVEITRLTPGQGQGTVVTVDVGAIHVDPVYRITATRTSVTAAGGTFSLAFRSDPLGISLATTDAMDFDTVAMAADEGYERQSGGRPGRSLQSKLMDAISLLPHVEWTNGTQVVVKRSPTGASSSYVWTVTIIGAPADFPSLVAGSSSSVPAMAVDVSTLTPTNQVGGTFSLSYQGKQTSSLSVSATASEIEDALHRLSTVRNTSIGFGRVIVRRREVRAVGGASFAVLFTEQLAPLEATALLTGDGAGFAGLGAFVRTQRHPLSPSLKGTWSFPGFGALDGREAWIGGLEGSFQADHFELRGPTAELQKMLAQFSYLLPPDLVGGYVSLALTAALPESSTATAMVKTDEQFLPFQPPSQVSVVSSNDADIIATRGRRHDVGLLQVEVPAWFACLLWVRLRVRVEHGTLQMDDRDGHEPKSELWINDTTRVVNTELLNLEYASSLDSTHAVDIFSAEIFIGDEATRPTSSNEFLVQINEPPFEPKISMTDDPMVFATEDSPTRISGLSIADANAPFCTTARNVDDVELSLQVDLGRLSVSQQDGLSKFASNDSVRLTLRGDVGTLNDALEHLYYEPSLVYDHARDTLTVRVRYHPSGRPVLTSSRTLQIQIQHSILVPRVVVADSNAITYAAQEDDGFRFPKLSLAVDSVGERGRIERARQPVAELRRTELLPAAVTTLKSSSSDDDWRHRWIGSFPGLTAATFASPSASSNAFFFRGSDLVNGEELWVSDGTPNGTKLLADLMPGDESSSPSDLTLLPPANNQVVFAARGIDRSWKLVTEKPCNSERRSSTAGDVVYVVATTSMWDPQATYDCPRPGWRWATTAEAQTRFPGRTSDAPMNLSEPYVFWDSCDWNGYSFGGVSRKHFRLADSVTTGALKHAGRRDSAAVEVSFSTTDFAGIVCVRDEASHDPAGREVWISDATGVAKRLNDIAPGPRGSNPRFFTPFQPKRLLFQAWTPDLGTELFRTDGTSAGTMLVEDIWRGPRSSDPSDFAEWTAGDGRMYFAATTEAGRELWSTDGLASRTAERGTRQTPVISGLLIGTALVRDICTSGRSSSPQFLTPMGSLGVFFSASDCINGRELWVTDGTLAGTKMVKDINAAAGQGSDPSHLVVFGAKLFFAATANADAMGRELFVSDGTAAGTKLLIELVPGAASAPPSLLTVANGRLYFHAANAHGTGELWVSDGTAAGTSRVWDAVFARSNAVQLASTSPVSSGRRSQLFVAGNALYYFTKRQFAAIDAQGDSSEDGDEFRLDVHVSHGAVHLPVGQNQSPAPSLTIEGTRRHLHEMLQRLVYVPPLNWNMLQMPDHLLVEWRFNVSSLSLSPAMPQVTTADLVVRPRVDPPVIIVPTAVEHPTRWEPDYLSRLRLECLPITVLEDTPTPLQGLSVRAADDADSRPHQWQLDLAVSRGRLDVGTGARCVRKILVGSLSGSKRVSVQATGIECLRRLLSRLVYTSDADASGSDALKIRVAMAAAAEDSVVVPIVVTEVNDAPYLTSRSSFYYEIREDEALVLRDLRVLDPDVRPFGRVQVDLAVTYGSIAILNDLVTVGSTVEVKRNDSAAWAPASSTRLVLSGPLADLNAALSRVVYTSARDWNSLAHGEDESDGYDTISVVLTDGQQFNATTRSVLFVYVAPTPDPVLISVPTVLQTSVYVALGDGVLHGDEDAWIETQGLGFTSEDDTARASLDVTIRVSHGRISLDDVSLRGVATSGSADDGSLWRLQGLFELVDGSVATLRYLPSANYYGADALEISATATDTYANEDSIQTSQVVPIQVHAVNDPPQWTLPAAPVAWIQDEPTRIAGVELHDVDFEALECTAVGCDLEVVVEVTGNAVITFPRLAELQHAPQFTASAAPLASSYLALAGTLQQLNLALSEIVLAVADAKAEVLEPVEIWFTADDRGTFGKGGPQVTRQHVVVMPLRRRAHVVQLLAPDDQTLTTSEDTPLVFDGSIRLGDADASTRSVAAAPQYKVEIQSDHGRFLLAATAFSATRLLLVPTPSQHVATFRGFLPQINAALNGSAYVPDENWFGPDAIRIRVRQVDTAVIDEDVAVTSLLVNVAPVCDSPRWRKETVASERLTDIVIDEDSQTLISSLSIEDPDTVIAGDVDREREVAVSIDVRDGGGVMLATTRGLRFANETFVSWSTPLEALRLLFFSRVVLMGRVGDVNAALHGLIYRLQPDFHTSGHILDAVVLNVSDSTSSCSNETDDTSVTLRVAINAINDAPVIISQRFRRVTRQEVAADSLQYGAPAMEAFQGQEQVLDAVSAFDADAAVTNSVDRLLPEPVVRLRVSCRSCSVRPTESLERLRSLNILVSLEPDRRDDNWSTPTTYYGSITALNQFVLASLVFTSAPQFVGSAVVLLEISDLGFDGRGGPQETAFAMVVRLHRVNVGPQILVPPYGTRVAPLQVDEHASVLVRGAPTDPAPDDAPHSAVKRHWQLVAVDPLAHDSDSRFKSLFDVASDDGRTATSFYASVGVHQFLFSAFDPATGVELWTSDGTAAGTRLLVDISPGPRSSHPQYLVRFSVDGLVYFSASGPNEDAWRLRSDLRDACDGFRESAFVPGVFFVVAQQTTWDPDETYDCPVGYQWMTTAEASAVFIGTVEDNSHAHEPLVYFAQCGWQGYAWGGQARSHFRFADSKGTGAFKHAGHRDSYRPDVGFETHEFAGIVCRRQYGDDEQPEWGSELWASDGTAEGTRRVVRIGDTSEGSRPAYLTEFQSRLFFQATTASYGAELWVSDGTRGGSWLVADVAFGTRSSSPEQLTVANGKLFFSAETATYGRELWVSDGQPRQDFAQADHGVPGVGTQLVLDIRGGQQSSNPQFLVALPAVGLLLFQADDGIHGAELWRSDGTAAGTSLVLDIRPGTLASEPRYLIHFNGKVFFQADDGVHGAELWATDGSAANTKLLVDLVLGARGSAPRYLTVLTLSSIVLAFSAATDRDPQVTEFWISDGTSGATTKLFSGSREVVQPNDLAMAATPRALSVGSGFVFFGYQRREPRYSSGVSRPVISRSLTLVDDRDDRSDRTYRLSLRCGYGELRLSNRRSCGFDDDMDAVSIVLRGPLPQLNCLVAEIVYRASRTRAGVLGWDDAITATLTEEQTEDGANDDGRAYSASQSLAVWVRALNHAPVVTLPTRIFAPLDSWMPLTAASVEDEDAGEDALLFLRVSVGSGRIRLVDEEALRASGAVLFSAVEDPRGAPSLELSATLATLAEAFARHVQYACLAKDGCTTGSQDGVTIEVDDNGSSGAGGPRSTVRSATVVVVAA